MDSEIVNLPRLVRHSQLIKLLLAFSFIYPEPEPYAARNLDHLFILSRQPKNLRLSVFLHCPPADLLFIIITVEPNLAKT